jgi:hypothetical protein
MWKEVSWPNLKYYPENAWRSYVKHVSRQSVFGLRFELGTSQYETGVISLDRGARCLKAGCIDGLHDQWGVEHSGHSVSLQTVIVAIAAHCTTIIASYTNSVIAQCSVLGRSAVSQWNSFPSSGLTSRAGRPPLHSVTPPSIRKADWRRGLAQTVLCSVKPFLTQDTHSCKWEVFCVAQVGREQCRNEQNKVWRVCSGIQSLVVDDTSAPAD